MNYPYQYVVVLGDRQSNDNSFTDIESSGLILAEDGDEFARNKVANMLGKEGKDLEDRAIMVRRFR